MMRRLAWGLAVCILGVVSYTLTWFYLAEKLRDNVDTLVLNLRNNGYEVSYLALDLGGYPFKMAIVAQQPKISRADMFETWVDGEIRFTSSLWSPNTITSVAGGEHFLVVHFPHDEQLRIKGEGFKVNLGVLELKKFDLSYDEAEVSIANQQQMAAKKIKLTIEVVQPDKESPAVVDTTLSLQDFSAPFLKGNPLSEKIQNLQVQATLHGELQGDSLVNKLRSWYEANGTIDLARLTVGWGPLNLQAEGTVALDENLQPLAAFSASVEGVNNMLDAMVKTKFISKKAAKLAKLGISLIATPTNDKTQEHRISVTIQDGQLSIGAVPITSIPKIKW